MRLVVDTGVFSAALSRHRPSSFDHSVASLRGNQLFLAPTTVAELRYGALVAGWGPRRRARLEDSIAATTIVPVTDALLTTMAELRWACRQAGHPLASPVHGNDLWIAATAVHLHETLVTADRAFADVPGLSLAS